MYEEDGRLVVSPSDLVGYLHCGHLTGLSLEVAAGRLAPPEVRDAEVAVVQRRGMDHERAYLSRLRAEGRTITEIPEGLTLEERVARTEEAMVDGPDIIYQATFLDRTGSGPIWRGHADFLARVEEPSRFGPFSWEPQDTKLARSVRPSAVLQLCEYAEQVGRLQGHPPATIRVILGGQEGVGLRLADFAACFRAAKASFAAACAANNGVNSYPVPVEHCAVCEWRSRCDHQRVRDDHLSLVPGLRADQARKLTAEAGIRTVAELAEFEGNGVRGVGTATFHRLRRQARLQMAARTRPDIPPYELLEAADAGLGLGALPPPSAGDLFFDIEGDPFVGSGGLEYLLGVGWVEPDRSFGFRAFWARTPGDERACFEAFIDFVGQRRSVHPDLHIYHYAPYERTALGRLMSRYGTREMEVDELFRSKVLVDLYRVVRQALRVGTPSYSLKKIEGLYMPARTEAITDAGSSIVEFERWLEEEDPRILQEIEAYNRVDCESTRLLRDWLESRRDEYAGTFGQVPPRPPAPTGAPTDNVTEEITDQESLKRSLAQADVAGIDGSGLAGADGPASVERASWLLGELLDWYRREDKPAWWEYFHRVQDCDDDDLHQDTEAIAGLTPTGATRIEKKSTVHEYRFDARQEFKLAPGDTPHDPAVVRRGADGHPVVHPGKLIALDPQEGTLELKRSTRSSAAHPRCLIPAGPLQTPVQREALRRIARSVLQHGMDGPGPYRAVRDLLLQRPPHTGTPPLSRGLIHQGESASDAVVRLGSDLELGCLAVQGPPGSGKTRAAARLAVGLIAAGKTIGITATSHAVISNLLETVGEEADGRGVPFRACQRADEGRVAKHGSVTLAPDNDQVLAALADGVDVVAGTAWLFAREEFDHRLDHLIIEEAGQFSLANALAVGTSAQNLVLVGDPLQLAQPSKGVHPDGAGISALGHLSGESGTMPDHLGVFLDLTHRLHPEICGFISEVIYEDRLHPAPGLERQRIGGGGALGGSGLRWVPVDHSGNRVDSQEEADAVEACFGDLLERTFTDRHGAERRMKVDDILVVAPYNAQVRLLGSRLPAGARIGTVDKFQGQQAPAVICSMTSSTMEELPRGMEFLLSRHRLNVAVSRAQAMSILVASPRLLAAECREVGQMRLVNGFCRYVELAERADRQPRGPRSGMVSR